MESLWRQYRERVLVVVGISVDVGAPRNVIAPYLSNLGLTFPVLLDPDMRTAQAWRVTALPATFIVGPEGDWSAWPSAPGNGTASRCGALVESLLPGDHRHPAERPASGTQAATDVTGAARRSETPDGDQPRP